jgi:pilus assembly protein CpaE
MLIVWDSDKRFRAKLVRDLDWHGNVHQAGSADEAATLAGGAGAATLLVGPAVDPKRALGAARELTNNGAGVVLMKSNPTPALMRAAMRAGVRDVIPATSSGEQIQAAVEAARRDTTRKGDGKGTNLSGKIITVFSAKGGCGKSFVSTNLAVLLAQQNQGPVALVDLDFDSGDQQIMLQLFDGRTFLDVVEELDHLDEDSLRSRMAVHPSGVHLLAAPAEPGLGETIEPAAVKRVLAILRSAFRYVVVDGPTTYTEHLLAALEVSDECLLVASLEVPAIRSLKVSLQTLDTLGLDKCVIRVVLNRADAPVGLSPQDVEKAVGRGVDVHVPASLEVPVSINRGIPLALSGPRSKVTKSLLGLAVSISGSTPGRRRVGTPGKPKDRPKHRSLFARREKTR